MKPPRSYYCSSGSNRVLSKCSRFWRVERGHGLTHPEGGAMLTLYAVYLAHSVVQK